MIGQSFLEARLDDKRGTGYGTDAGRFSHRLSNSNFPYNDFDDDEFFEEEDLETQIHQKKIINKTSPYAASGWGDKAKVDKRYFVAGNTKLSDCFFRTDKILLEIEIFNNSLVPIPGLYKKSSMVKGSGPFLPAGIGSYKRTGTKKGYASSPPEYKIDFDLHGDNEEDIEDDEVLTLRDIALRLNKIDGYT